MKILKKISLISLFLLTVLSFPIKYVSHADNQVTVKLVLSEGVTVNEQYGVNDETIFHQHVINYSGLYNSDLPIAVKAHNTFTGWFFAENGQLIKVTKMPKVSGAIYFAFFEGDGVLANIVEPPPIQETMTIYLDTGGPGLWNQAGALFYVYTFNRETSGAWPGKKMDLHTGNIFKATITLGFDYLIFVRTPDPSGPYWNQSEDLVYNKKFNTYVVTGWDESNYYWTNTSTIIF